MYCSFWEVCTQSLLAWAHVYIPNRNRAQYSFFKVSSYNLFNPIIPLQCGPWIYHGRDGKIDTPHNQLFTSTCQEIHVTAMKSFKALFLGPTKSCKFQTSSKLKFDKTVRKFHPWTMLELMLELFSIFTLLFSLSVCMLFFCIQ